MSNSHEEKLGNAIENSAKNLPDGYVLEISIERGGYAVELITAGERMTIHDGSSIVDEIETLTAIAVKKVEGAEP